MIINGLVFDRNALSDVKCITFKKSHLNEFFISDGYLHIRTTGDISSDILSIPNINTILLGAYDPNRPIDWGFFFVAERRVTINGYEIVSNVLRDNTTIVSLMFPSDIIFTDQNGNPSNIIVFAFEDYIILARNEVCTPYEFTTAMMSINNFLINPMLLYNLHTTPFPYPMFEVTATNQASPFTTYSLVPNWRYNEKYVLGNRSHVHVRSYYNLEIDFKDYFNVLLNRLREITHFPLYHKSENIKVNDRDIAFITYKIEYQDKSVNAIYMDTGIFETHKYYSAKIQFVFQTTDFFIYRGFINQYFDQRRITNILGEVCYTPPNGLEYCASIKWSLDEPTYEVQNDFSEIESERGYYHYTIEFYAEMYYFAVRSKYMDNIIEEFLGIITEPAPIPDCNKIRSTVTKLVYNINTSGVTFSDPSGEGYVVI